MLTVYGSCCRGFFLKQLRGNICFTAEECPCGRYIFMAGMLLQRIHFCVKGRRRKWVTVPIQAGTIIPLQRLCFGLIELLVYAFIRMFMKGDVSYGINWKFIEQYQQSCIRGRWTTRIRGTCQWAGQGYINRIYDLCHPGENCEETAEETVMGMETDSLSLCD